MIRVALMSSSMRGGGSEQQILLLARHLDRTRFQPSLFLGEQVGSLLQRVPDDVAVHGFAAAPSRLYWPGRMFSQTVHKLRQLADQHAIDVVYDRTFGMTMFAAAAFDRIGIPRVSTIVSPPELAVPAVAGRFVALKRHRLKKAYRDSATRIAVSDQAAASASRYYRLPRDQFRTIRNPVDQDFLASRANETVAMSADAGLSSVVIVGRLTAEKGHADLLDAIAKLPADLRRVTRFRLVGDGPLRQALIDQAGRLGIASVVRFDGHLDNPWSLMRSSALLVLPSRFEGLPNVVLEAMALGVPVVATDAGGTSELSPDSGQPNLVLVPPRQPSALASAIESILRNAELARSLVERSRRYIAEHHQPTAVVEQISDCLSTASRGGTSG